MKTEKLKTYYLIIGMVCLCFLTASVGFTFYSMEEYEKKDISHFKENVESMRNSVSNMIKGNIEILDGMALTIGQMEITDIEHLQPIIKKVNDRNAFLQMGFVDADGTGDMVDLDGTIHRDVDFSDESFFQKAMGGETAISNTFKDEYTNGYLNYYGVPVVIQGETVGILAAADKTDRLREVLDVPIFSKGGYANVIDDQGAYVVRSINSPAIEHIEDIGDFTEEELKNIHRELKEGEEDFIRFNKEGKKTWAAYMHLGINDWYLLGIVSKDATGSAYHLFAGMIIIVTSAMAIFIFLVYCITRVQVKNERELERLAYQDPLLGINNYIKFNKDLSETLAKEGFRKIAFWYCDIDNFKLFNESFGYEAGDQLLKSLAQLFDECARKDELFCRETSDHYVGIRYYKEPSELKAWYEELTERLEHYHIFKQQSFRLVLSMGFYCADMPEHLLTVNEMYNRARIAQKTVKEKKNIKYAFYSDSLHSQLLRENEIEANMNQALCEHRFKVYVQPKAALADDNRISGGEALVRWADPEKGMISPGEFIPLFEKNGFIVPLDRYMMESVCQWLHGYMAAGGRPIRLAVNVSRLGIFQEDFVDYYTNMKNQYQIPDGLLELEFTESLAIEDNSLLRQRIDELTARGFICSLDDFGAGYSSLNTLKDLAIQVLKLDMLFFKRSDNDEKAKIIIANIVRMAKQLHIRVVAEGVEEPEQVEFLKECGCDIIQGYVFERPMPCDEFERLLSKDPHGDWGSGFKRT